MMAVLKHWQCMTEQHQVITICSSHVTISALSAPTRTTLHSYLV